MEENPARKTNTGHPHTVTPFPFSLTNFMTFNISRPSNFFFTHRPLLSGFVVPTEFLPTKLLPGTGEQIVKIWHKFSKHVTKSWRIFQNVILINFVQISHWSLSNKHYALHEIWFVPFFSRFFCF